jgi:cephalosporin-C deacetylase-like acetyl esterase
MHRRSFAVSLLAPLALRGERQPSYGEQYPDMLLSLLARRINDAAAQWDRERARITTPAQIEAWNRAVRKKMIGMMHGLPDRNPLQPVIVSSFARNGYRVENVMFQSRPNFWVTGNLYIPTGPGPFPGIISPCGHYDDARMNPEYQCAYIDLVLAGFVVLAYDPVGQGERRQYWNPSTNATEVGGPTTEHSMAGQLLLLMGEDLTNYRVWDGMRAIDYLLTRAEVDPKRIGCAGHSGGGTLTRFIAAIDTRVQCAVINEGGTANRWPIELRPESRIGPSDVEQNLFPGAALGVDNVDMHVAIAPRPLLCLIEDYSPRFNQAAEQIRLRYQQLGAANKFATEEAADPHAWTPKLRLATARWFSRWFYDKPGPDAESDFATEPAEKLYCTPNGSIRYSQKGETIYTLIAKKVAALPPDRPLTREKLRELLRLPDYTGGLGVRTLVTTERKGYRIEKIEFISEPGVYIPTWVFVPPKPDRSKTALFYVHESGKEIDGGEFGRLEKLVRGGELIVAIDVRGIGGTRPPHPPASAARDPFSHLFDVETAMAYLAWYLDQSLLGMRVHDVMRAVDYTLTRDDVNREGVRITARGAGSLWSLFAAALDPRIASLDAERMLLSYKTLASSDRYLHNASLFLKDGLLHTDLPQIASLIAPRPVTLIEPVDAMKRRVNGAAASEAYRVASNVKFAYSG